MRPWSVTASLAFILMTLLLMMFLYAVVATPPEEATRSSEEPALEPLTPPPPAPAPALAARSRLKILVCCLGLVDRAARVYASAQVPVLVRVSPRLTRRRRLRAAARWWSQVLFLVTPR